MYRNDPNFEFVEKHVPKWYVPKWSCTDLALTLLLQPLQWPLQRHAALIGCLRRLHRVFTAA